MKKIKEKRRKEITMDALSLILIIVGALNWGSIGLFGFDIVGAIFGGQLSVFSRIIFTIVGLGGLWAITFFFKNKIFAVISLISAKLFILYFPFYYNFTGGRYCVGYPCAFAVINNPVYKKRV